jgi:Tetratricopeptide repeat
MLRAQQRSGGKDAGAAWCAPAARELDEDTLARRCRDLGEDHPDTLTSAFTVAAELGEYQAARELDEDTLARRRRVLGDGHPDTMVSASFTLILSGLVADPKARATMETMKAAWSQRGEGREPDN